MDTNLINDVSISLISYREFYEQCRTLRENYARKMAKGIYDRELGIKGLTPHVTEFLKSPLFARLYCSDIKVTPQERQAIASEILEHWEEEIKDSAWELKLAKEATR